MMYYLHFVGMWIVVRSQAARQSLEKNITERGSLMQTLIVVYKDKDEMCVNQLRKLIETNDDRDGVITGVEDGSVQIVPWTEKVWLQNKEAGTIKSKVLLIGGIKGVEHLWPIVDIKYDKHGVRYGWAGSQAVLKVDEKALGSNDAYEDFLAELRSKASNAVANDKRKLGWNKKSVGKGIGAVLAPYVWPAFVASLIKDGFHDSRIVRQQMLLLGVSELYTNHLDQFMKG